jgi:hypothetical protein
MKSHQVSVFIERSPWRWIIPVQCLQITPKHMSVFVENHQKWQSLLREGDRYSIQIDSEDGFQTNPTALAELKALRRNQLGIEVDFVFPNDLALT